MDKLLPIIGELQENDLTLHVVLWTSVLGWTALHVFTRVIIPETGDEAKKKERTYLLDAVPGLSVSRVWGQGKASAIPPSIPECC